MIEIGQAAESACWGIWEVHQPGWHQEASSCCQRRGSETHLTRS